MKGAKWEARIRRAEELAATYPFASEGLRFYRGVVEAQGSIYAKIQASCGAEKKPRHPGTLRDEFDSFLLLPMFPSFLAAIEKDATAPLAAAARGLRDGGATHSHEILARFWHDPDSSNGVDPAETLLSWAFLQPYAEYLADHTQAEPIHATPSVCPLCGSKPLAGVLRPEGDGAKRSLICALCAHEWAYRRIVCPGCGEEDVHKLAVYTAQDFGHVRVEACDSCRTYIKTVDLTKNGRALPAVDELATIPLNLWAVEHGYTKLRTNLLGI